MKEGFIIINKPKGITSFRVVHALRKITGVKKIGHCGTLDPLATGVLICAIGRSATKKIDCFRDQEKEYIAKVELGKKSNTYDLEGTVTNVKFSKRPTIEDIRIEASKFVGEIFQTPPIFSAKKINGVRSYNLARAGEKIKLKRNKIFIESIKIISYKWPFLKIRIICGKGTYIRSLANDIGENLSCGGLLIELTRTRIGRFDLKKSASLEEINQTNWEHFLLNDALWQAKKKNY